MIVPAAARAPPAGQTDSRARRLGTPSGRGQGGELRDQGAATRPQRRRNPGEVNPAARRDQRFPRRILKRERRRSGMLAVIDDAGVARRRARLEEHQTETRPGHPADMARIDAMAARLAIDDPAERSFREPRHPGDLAAEPRQNAADIELAAADTSLEQ